MKGAKYASGIVRRIDNLGRIVLPKELRDTNGLSEGTALEILLDDDGNVVLRKYEPGCSACGQIDDLVLFKDIRLCRKCLQSMTRAVS